jgi:glycosyltransferase involved in cell wall biosynthesis
VDIDISPVEKTNHILSVGRFAVVGAGKKQIEMLQLFDQLKTTGHKDWNYDCVGGCGTSAEELAFLQKANQLGEKCGANVIANLGHAQLKNLYRKAKIFWHAAGMNVDENLQPELAEHFGMTTAEAMAAGCVPVVINKGGQPEIVEHGVSGFLWNTPEEWRAYTVRLMQDDSLFQKMSSAAREHARLFSREAYVKRFHSLLAPYLNE